MQSYQRIDDDDHFDESSSNARHQHGGSSRRPAESAQPLEPGTFCPDTFQPDQILVTQSDRHNDNRWRHIVDLDEFFTRIYEYHRRRGFFCIILSDVLELARFLFVAIFVGFLFSCVNYEILFKRSLPANFNYTFTSKLTLADSIYPDWPRLNFPLVVCLLTAVVFWIYRLIVTLWMITQSWEVKRFYTAVLKIYDSEIDNLTWHEVLQKLRDAQSEYRFCIHKEELTELDVYHRILRRKNYTIAMVNKNLLPAKFSLPFVGEISFFTNGFKFNFEFLFFLGWWSPWQDYWHLKNDYKKREKIKELANAAERAVFWLAVVNLTFSPIVFIWQIFYSFFSYGELVKREPAALGVRRWSIFGKYYFRHFNELDHELENRLSRGYSPAVHYMEMFTSSVMEILAKNVAFFLGAPFIVLVVLGVYDEDVLQVEHVLTIITVFGLIIAVCRASVANENLVWCPELMMKAVYAQVHYLPDAWKNQAHTECVRREFSQLFQYKATFVFEELISPLVTPFVLLFWLKPRCYDILDFMRKFTVEMPGLGDVCSFASMDVQKHGDPSWQPANLPTAKATTKSTKVVAAMTSSIDDGGDVIAVADNGKTEMSLVHFTITNPRWQPPMAAANFLADVQQCVNHDIQNIYDHQAMFENPLVQSLSSITTPYASPLFGVFPGAGGHHHSSRPPSGRLAAGGPPLLKGPGVGRQEGPLAPADTGILASLRASTLAPLGGASGGGGMSQTMSSIFGGPAAASLISSPSAAAAAAFGDGTTAAEMAVTSLYLRELHDRKVRPRAPASYGSLQFRESVTPPGGGGAGHNSTTNIWEVPRDEEKAEETAPDLFHAT